MPPVVDPVLTAAADHAGLTLVDASLLRDGSNRMYQLADGVIARIGAPGTVDNARHQIAVATWLGEVDFPTVRPVAELPQPIAVQHRPVTWWHALPAHRHATPGELGAVLRDLHALPKPTQLPLPEFDPLHGVDERLVAAGGIAADDRRWLTHQLADLRARLNEHHSATPNIVVHGDAWQGNVAVPDSGAPTLLDLEHVACGQPEWDLIPLAVDATDFARLSTADYSAFTAAYGSDVTTSPVFRLYADIQLLRWVCFSLSKAHASGAAAAEARHRIACLRGDIARPWSWTAL